MDLKELLKKSINECDNLFFPKICLHCSEKSDNQLFCSNCISFFDLQEKSEIKSFENYSVPLISAFTENGPVATLLSEIKKMKKPALIKTAASYMACQYLKLGYELPDLVVPLADNGFENQYINALTKHVALLFSRPIKRLFFKAKIAVFQTALLIKKTNLKEKKILLVTDKLDEKKLALPIEKLKNEGFTDISILAFCQ